MLTGLSLSLNRLAAGQVSFMSVGGATHMSLESPGRDCPTWLHFLAHAGAAVVCFTLIVFGTIGGLFAVLGIPDDPGGPLFFVVLFLGVVLFAAWLTAVSGV